MADILFLGAGIEAAITSTNGIHSNYSYPGFPVNNLLDRNKNTLWKSNLNGDVYIKVDLGSLIDVEFLALIGGNPYTGGSYSGTKWRLQVSKMTSWTAGSSDITGTLVPTASNEPLWLVDCTDCNSRYFQFNLKETVQGTAQVGTLLLGIPMVFALPYNRPITKGKQAGIDIRESKGGKRYANKRYGGRRLWTPANFSILTQAQWDDLVTYLWDASSEGLYPVLFRDTDGSLHWVRVNKGGALFWTHNVHNIWDTPLTIETEL